LRPSGGGARRCTCGTCKQCLENARWERIFNEKFGDPDYYAANHEHGFAVRIHPVAETELTAVLVLVVSVA
jgi:hypothetical protein